VYIKSKRTYILNRDNNKAAHPIAPYHHIGCSSNEYREVMEGLSHEESIPTDEDFIPTEPERSNATSTTTITGRSMSGTLYRKVAKRTYPWLPVTADPLTSPIPIDGDIPVARKPRLEVPLLASPTAEEGASRCSTNAASPDAEEAALPHTVALPADDDAKDGPVTYTQSHASTTTRAAHRFTPEEDAKLSSVVANTRKKKWGQKCRIDWVAVAVLVPGRTKEQCSRRWFDALNPIMNWTPGHKGLWTTEEDCALKDAVQRYGGKHWIAIATLIPSRTREQCWSRWRHNLKPSIYQATVRKGSWTTEEHDALKKAVENYGGKKWDAIAALVPGRTKPQCYG
jgi:hypothetical protein